MEADDDMEDTISTALMVTLPPRNSYQPLEPSFSKSLLKSRSSADSSGLKPTGGIRGSMSVSTRLEQFHSRNSGNYILGATRMAAEAAASRRLSRMDRGTGTLLKMLVPPTSFNEKPSEHVFQPLHHSEFTLANLIGGPIKSHTEYEVGKGRAKFGSKSETVTISDSKVRRDSSDIESIPAILGATETAFECLAGRKLTLVAGGNVESLLAKLTSKVKGATWLESPAQGDKGTSKPDTMSSLQSSVEHCENESWYTNRCTTKYATVYPMPPKPKKKEAEVARKKEEPVVILKREKRPWCGLCMRESLEPYHLPCGHSFCRRCIVESNYTLLKDFADIVKDTRAVMRCPLRHCKAVIPCFPLINGDLRFKQVRPEEKVQVAKRPEDDPCEQHRLTHYKVRLDFDFTKRKSDDLFRGFKDVVVIP